MAYAGNGTGQRTSVGRWPTIRRIVVLAALLAMLAGAGMTASAQPSSDLAAHKELVGQYYDAWNSGDADVMAAILGGETTDLSRAPQELRAVFPDLTVTIDKLVAEGDTVVASVTYRGTHLGPFESWFMDTVAPTGRPVTVGSTEIFTIAAGKIVHFEEQVDLISLLVQLGISQRAPDASAQPQWSAAARLQDVAGRELGVAYFAEAADGTVSVELDGEGLAQGDHGLHVHETGSCDPAGEKAFSSAGGHFNPTGVTHGEHGGDLGNLPVGDGGWYVHATTTDRLTLSPGENSILDADGSALVIHADPDDGVTDPAGNAGARFACGVIVAGLTDQ